MEEEQTATLLAPSPETLASVRVFPLIPSIKKDVVVSTAFYTLAFRVVEYACRKTLVRRRVPRTAGRSL